MKHNKTLNSGFTLLETLLTVAILVILLALSMVGVARYKDHLKITELDNAARDIYMAAENRAVLLQNSGRLGTPSAALLLSIDPETVDSKNVRILSNTTSSGTLDELLPVGSIDPALQEKYFRVVYDEATGHVVEVFYGEKEIDSDLTLFRGKTRSERISVFRGGKSLVGYYGSEAAPPIGTKPLPTPGVEVLITNDSELTLTVRYTMPTNADGSPVAATRAPKVTLTYDGKEVTLLSEDGSSPYTSRLTPNIPITDITNPASAEYTWVLDSLESGKQFGKLEFKNSSGVSVTCPDLGDNFTVKASLKLTADGYIESAYYATGTDNSLFAKGTNYSNAEKDGVAANTALIANLRHLQNLCAAHSAVGMGTANAEQLCSIDCEKAKRNDGTDITPSDERYSFIPIENDNLKLYDGKNFHIYSLTTKETTDAGLFGKVDSGQTLNIENCRVCWSAPEKLVKTDNTDYIYAVSGANAGGLVGSVGSGGTVNVKNSFAATTAKGTSTTGGLVGSASGTVKIENSYADCYLNTGDSTTANAGGLVGSASGTVKIENSYAAGFIVDPASTANTAGLTNGSVTAPSNVYSVVRVLKTAESSKTTLEAPKTPLYTDAATAGNVRYLYKAAEVKASETPFGSAFEYAAATPETHVYNMWHKLDGSAEELKAPYIFPGLNGLPHYCDWAELDDVAGLVYYEVYAEKKTVDGVETTVTTYGVDYGRDNTGAAIDGSNLLGGANNPIVTRDGYALKFDALPEGEYKVNYGAQKWTLTKTTAGTGDSAITEWKWTKTVPESETALTQTVELLEGKMIPLPDAIVTGELSDKSHFYQKLDCDVKDAGAVTDTFYFNPHFAKSVVGPTKKEDGTVTQPTQPEDPTTETSPACVRTARHLYDLSAFQTAEYNYTQKSLYFKQELDIDYSDYTVGYDSEFLGKFKYTVPTTGTKAYKQNLIGTSGEDKSFTGTYDGKYHMIKNVFFNADGTDTNLGLFGTTAPGSTLTNIVYDLNLQDETVNKSGANVGALVGLNGGTVNNCAVYGVSMTATAGSVGGLAGQNSGEVKNCAAEVASLTVTLPGSDDFAGGLVGLNDPGKSVSSSYAVGRITGSTDNTGIIAGLIGDSKGAVSTSYAAVDLSGNGDKYGLCSGTTVPINSGWIEDAFVYRGQKFNTDETGAAEHKDPGYAVSFKGTNGLTTKLKDVQDKVASGNTLRNVPDGASYASTYESKDFPYLTGVTAKLDRKSDGTIGTEDVTAAKSIHYGLWPLPLPIGLSYYEQYNSGADGYGAYGKFEAVDIKTLKENNDNPATNGNPNITKDGYALVFEGGTSDIPAGKYKVVYGKGDGDTENTQNWTLTKSSGGFTWAGATDTVTPIEITQDGKSYTLIPLPVAVNTEKLADIYAFYQKVVCGEGMFDERTYYFNPHFAKTVKATDTLHEEPTSDKYGSNGVYVYVRTPRHLYDLSRFQESSGSFVYHQRSYYYSQELDLDYNTYDWYGKDGTGGENGNVRYRPVQMRQKDEGGNSASDGDPYYMQPSIARENDNGDIGSGGMNGAYDGRGHEIKNVFYETPNIDKKLHYLGLFKYIDYLYNVIYEVPDNMVVTLNNFHGPGEENNGLDNAIKVGTLAGGTFVPKNCEVKINNLTVTSEKADIYVGGMFGYVNGHVGLGGAKNCRASITGTLKVERIGDVGHTPYKMDVAAGGLAGIVANAVQNCESNVNTMIVEGNDYCYAGGLVGRTSANIDYQNGSPGCYQRRVIMDCAATVKELRVEGKGNVYGEVYGGGLTGWGNHIYRCGAVITKSLTAITSASDDKKVYAGGLAGGGSEVRNCYAIAATVTATGTNSYAGGLLGVDKMGYHTRELSDYYNGNFPDLKVENSYAAVAVLSGNTTDAFCGHTENWEWKYTVDENNIAVKPEKDKKVTIENCCFLNGDAESWQIDGTNNKGASSTIEADKVTGKSYDELKGPAGAPGTDWGTLPGTDVYPFPVSTTRPKKKIENGEVVRDENGNIVYETDGNGNIVYEYYYPSTVWPVKTASATTLADEPAALLDALPVEPKSEDENES